MPTGYFFFYGKIPFGQLVCGKNPCGEYVYSKDAIAQGPGYLEPGWVLVAKKDETHT